MPGLGWNCQESILWLLSTLWPTTLSLDVMWARKPGVMTPASQATQAFKSNACPWGTCNETGSTEWSVVSATGVCWGPSLWQPRASRLAVEGACY